MSGRMLDIMPDRTLEHMSDRINSEIYYRMTESLCQNRIYVRMSVGGDRPKKVVVFACCIFLPVLETRSGPNPCLIYSHSTRPMLRGPLVTFPARTLMHGNGGWGPERVAQLQAEQVPNTDLRLTFIDLHSLHETFHSISFRCFPVPLSFHYWSTGPLWPVATWRQWRSGSQNKAGGLLSLLLLCPLYCYVMGLIVKPLLQCLDMNLYNLLLCKVSSERVLLA